MELDNRAKELVAGKKLCAIVSIVSIILSFQSFSFLVLYFSSVSDISHIVVTTSICLSVLGMIAFIWAMELFGQYDQKLVRHMATKCHEKACNDVFVSGDTDPYSDIERDCCYIPKPAIETEVFTDYYFRKTKDYRDEFENPEF